MNDELQKKLVEYLGSVERMANDAILVGKEEIPQYLRELIKWEIVSHGMWAVLCFAIVPACLPVIYWAWKNKDEICDVIPLAMFPGVGAIVAICIGVGHVEASAKAYFAPRVLLVEKLSSMVRK